jgi:DNA-nicking Smr family endonuclease
MVTRRTRPAVPTSDVSRDEMELFEREVADARPMAKDTPERVSVKRQTAPGTRGPGVQKPSAAGDEVTEAALASYVAPGVDRRELRKLRRGDYAPDVRLDLHGLMAAEAVARVARVLESAPGRRPRCLCVVHGRGLRSAGNVAVLKPRVRQSLRAHRAVLAFSDAPPNDGGPGAVYVLLRR